MSNEEKKPEPELFDYEMEATTEPPVFYKTRGERFGHFAARDTRRVDELKCECPMCKMTPFSVDHIPSKGSLFRAVSIERARFVAQTLEKHFITGADAPMSSGSFADARPLRRWATLYAAAFTDSTYETLLSIIKKQRESDPRYV